MLPRTSRNTCWIVDSFTQVKLAKHMVKSKTKSISNRGAFSSFNVQSIIFSKFLHEYWSGSRDGSYLFRYGVKESAKLQNMRACTDNAPINVMLAEGKAGHGVGIWLSLLALTDLVLPREGIFESFFARRGDIWLPTRTKKTWTEHMFPASRMRRTV